MKKMYNDANQIINTIIAENMPQQAVVNALRSHEFAGKIYLIAIGKAAWTMAQAASGFLGERLVSGIVITKYKHSREPLPRINIFEAGHPISDKNTITATQHCVELAENLTADDELLFLVSGGGSALFEKPLNGVTLEDIQAITGHMLASGADITEINILRKRFSAVKAGRFAKIAAPAKIFAIVLSDVLGDSLDSIASGPVAPDLTTAEDAAKVAEKYGLAFLLTDLHKKYLLKETPKEINNLKAAITGSVRTLCDAAAKVARELNYAPYILTATMNCEARAAGQFMASVAADTQDGKNTFTNPCAIIAGGETVVTIKGSGTGGRNQELALSAARGIAGRNNILIFSLGSDGTDGPTDAAGGIVDGGTAAKLRAQNLDIDKILANNDSYHGLKAADGLIITGPTGTNVNDVTVVLCGL